MLLLLCMLHFSTDTSVPSEMVGSLNYSLIFRFQKKKRSIYIYFKFNSNFSDTTFRNNVSS